MPGGAASREKLWKDLGLDFVRIPGGEFAMGDKNKPSLQQVKEFLLARTEVTVAQFRSFVEATGHKTRSETRDPCRRYAGGCWDTWRGGSWRVLTFTQTDNHPVVCISWIDAMAFCDWAGVRLPTTAEWEYAAGNGARHTLFSWGDGAPVGRLGGNLADESAKREFGWWWAGTGDYLGYDDGWAYTAPVGSYLPNDFGLYDMTGNVYEWCAEDQMIARLDSPNPNAGIYMRLLRGGSWNVTSGNARVIDDTAYFPHNSSDFIGFRVARDADVTPVPPAPVSP